MGYYRVPAFDDSDTYFKHLDYYEENNGMPELELCVTLTMDTGGQLTYTEKASAEQGWGVSYWPFDYEPLWDGQEYYPGCFAVMSYESLEAPPDIRAGSSGLAWEENAICVEATVGGVPVDPASCRVVTREEPIMTFEDGELSETGQSYYYTTLVIPRPEDAPEHGAAKITVYQRLRCLDTVWAENREIEY